MKRRKRRRRREQLDLFLYILIMSNRCSLRPSVEAMMYIVKHFGENKDKCVLLHVLGYTQRTKMDIHRSVGKQLINVLLSVGFLSKAQNTFYKLEHVDVISWSSLIIAHVRYGNPHQALVVYRDMFSQGRLYPSDRAYAALLKACSTLKNVNIGVCIHDTIAQLGMLESNVYVGSALVDMYAKCGVLPKAQDVFDMIPVRNVVSWTALIGGYVEHGHGKQALKTFENMLVEGCSPNPITFICILKACGIVSNSQKGKEIHAEIERIGILEKEVNVGNTLIDMYAKCGAIDTAQEAFDKLRNRDVVSWTTLMSAFADNGFGQEALECFEDMQCNGVAPDGLTVLRSLRVCRDLRAIGKGEEIHVWIRKHGHLERNVALNNMLVDMYAKFGLLHKAEEVFKKLKNPSAVSFASLIAGYSHNGDGEKALECFQQMQSEGIVPDAITYVCVLKACGSLGNLDSGIKIHDEIKRQGLMGRNVILGNALVDMYVKSGSITKAKNLFDSLPIRNTASWNTLMNGYVDNEYFDEVLDCFEQMQLEGVLPNAITLVCVLKACRSFGAGEMGGDLHAEIERKGLLNLDIGVGNSLIDMYAKCGSLAAAQEVFDKLGARDVVSWNSLLAGYIQLGRVQNVFNFFSRMVGEHIKPDIITFVLLLNACSRTGHYSKCQTYFDAMSAEYGICPTVEHHAEVVDLLCRTGNLDKAIATIKQMPVSPDLVVWRTVLGACRTWGNFHAGKEAFEHAVVLDESDSSSYVLMSQVYTGG